MRYFLCGAHTLQMAGKFSLFFNVFFSDLNFDVFVRDLSQKSFLCVFPAVLQYLEMCVFCVNPMEYFA